MVKVIAIVGPTAVGKTKLSIELAKKLNGEIISGDSMQVYRNLDIGTAKVTEREKQGVPHHLIDIRDCDQRFSVADFQKLANKAIVDIDKKGRLPIIVGGTGFYVQALVENLTLGDDHFDKTSNKIRTKWQSKAKENGNEYVWQYANKIDPVAARKIPVSNVRRAIRVIEVYERTGKLFSEQANVPGDNDYYLVGLNTDRQVLYQRINDRVDQMIDTGLLSEARDLFDRGGMNYQSGKGIGYRELFPYFRGEVSLADAVDDIKKDSRHYAKRQLTWFRNKMTVHWYDLVNRQNSIDEIISDLRNWL